MYAVFSIEIKSEYEFTYDLWIGDENITYFELRKQLLLYIQNFYQDAEVSNSDLDIDILYKEYYISNLSYYIKTLQYFETKEQVIDKILQNTEAAL